MVVVGFLCHTGREGFHARVCKVFGAHEGGRSEGQRWIGYVEDVGSSELDEGMLWDIVRKTSHVLNPKTPPRGSRGIDHVLEVARTRLERITPQQAIDELHDLTFPLPVVIVDIRPANNVKNMVKFQTRWLLNEMSSNGASTPAQILVCLSLIDMTYE